MSIPRALHPADSGKCWILHDGRVVLCATSTKGKMTLVDLDDGFEIRTDILPGSAIQVTLAIAEEDEIVPMVSWEEEDRKVELEPALERKLLTFEVIAGVVAIAAIGAVVLTGLFVVRAMLGILAGG